MKFTNEFTRDDLDPSRANEDLPIDWKAYSAARIADGGFDSAEDI